MKAKFINALPDRYGKYVDYEYEYKNHTYFVRKYFAGNAMGEELWRQHKEAQEQIDNQPSHKAEEPEVATKNGADEGFDLFWKFVEGEEV